MIITNKLTMDLNRCKATPVIHAVQDDRYSRNIELSLLADGMAWLIPERVAVRIRYSKPDGKGGEYDCLPDGSCAWSAEENRLTLALAPQVLTVSGAVRLAVTMMQDQIQISTFAIVLDVSQAVHTRVCESEDYFPGYTMPAEPNADDIPKVFFGSALPQTKDDTIMSFRYISKTRDIRGYCRTKAQGSSSMSYPKKNQTTKLYKDADCTEELNIAFREWGPRNKFCFKANWIDHSHARNIIGARLWSQVVSCRSDYDTLPTELRNSPGRGAIDGFPVKLYADGVYQGIYTMNIPKDAWMLNLDEGNPNHALLCAETNSTGEVPDTACNFRALWAENNADHWSVVVGTKTDAVTDSFNALICCVKDTDDHTFRQTIGNHLDVQSAIDYWIHQYIICGLDGLGKNMLMATYDGRRWFCSAYDMDSTFGLFWNGTSFVSAHYRCPEDYQESRSLLWERICTLFAAEVKERYIELREKVYSYENLFNHFERFADVIGTDLYAEDLTIYPGIPNGSINHIQQIRSYIKDRLYYTDVCFGAVAEPEAEETVIVTDYVQSQTDAAATFEIYNGPVDWETQSLVLELAVEHTNTDGYVFYIGENITSLPDCFAFDVWYWDNRQYFRVTAQSDNVNGSWAQFHAGHLSNLITDWSNIKLEINRHGIFVNDSSIADLCNEPEVYTSILGSLTSASVLQVGKKLTNTNAHPITFKRVYFRKL